MIHTSTGDEALAWCKLRVADVLVTDVRLPGQLDGCRIADIFAMLVHATCGNGVLRLLSGDNAQPNAPWDCEVRERSR